MVSWWVGLLCNILKCIFVFKESSTYINQLKRKKESGDIDEDDYEYLIQKYRKKKAKSILNLMKSMGDFVMATWGSGIISF